MDFTKIQSPTKLNLLVSFTDLSGFARAAGKMSEESLFAFITHIYEMTEDTVEEAGGTVVKFMGDSALIVFPENLASVGILALKGLKQKADTWMAQQRLPCRVVIKAHLGEVICGNVGRKKRFDLFGATVNTAAVLASKGFSLSPQAFRSLDKEARKSFKKHTPPVTYIPVEDPHKD